MASLVAVAIVVLALVLVLVLVVRRNKRKQKAAVRPKVEDKNPVYGMYYFADGKHIDEGRSEVTDGNDYYGC